MTDAEGPQRRALCFLSTLLSQKVPEKADLVLRCMISGQPKPEVTWYKNGQTIDECDIVSSYEFFEHQYIHVLHLSCCTKSDAAVYQISAKNCLGMICCSATIEVESPSENPRLPPDLGDDRDAEWKCDTQDRDEEESTNGTAESEHPCRKEGRLSAGAPTPADSSSLKDNHLRSPHLLANNDISASSSGNAPDVKETRQTAEADDPNSTGEIFLNSNNTEKQDACCHRTESSPVSRPVHGGLNSDGPNDEILPSTPQNPKAQKYISFSLPLSEATAYVYSGDSVPVNKQSSPQVSSEDSDSDYELCPEITLTCMEEFSDDDLEYLECSDVMTDYTNAVWQRSLQGTEHVFLLESDDEETEFSEYGLGGREMGCGPWVSGDTGPMDATTGFCGYHSQLQEVGVKSSGASRHSPSSLLAGMTLTLGPHQDGTALVSEQGRCPLPTASEAAENDYPGIQGETRDSHQVGEEFASDNLLTMDEAVTETEVKPSSGGLEKSGRKQSLEIAAEERGAERDLGSRKGIQRSARLRRPGARGKAKKLTPKESAAGGTLASPPKEPAQRPPGWSHDGEIPCARATAPGGNSHFHTGECAISPEAEQATETLPPPGDSVPREGATNFKGEGLPVNNLFTTSQVPDQSAHPQGQNQESARERSSLSQTPAFPEPAGKESPFTGTTADSFSNLWGIHKENASLAQYLEGGHAQGPQQEEEPGREGHAPGSSGANEEHEQNTQGAHAGKMSLAAPLAPLLWDASADSKEPEELQSLSATSPGSMDTSLTLENVCKESRGREAACATECFGFSDQGMCCDTMDSPVGAPADKYLPQEICCMDYELTEGQSKVCDLCPSDDKTLAVLLQTRGSEPPPSTCENSKDKNTAVSPLSISTVTWNMSQEANEGAAGGHQAEVENSSCILSSTAQAGQKSPIPLSLGGCGETHRLSSEDNILLHFKEGGDQNPSVPVTIDPPVNHGSILRLWPETSKALTANAEGLQVAREIEDKSIIAVATEVHPAECQIASSSENSIADGVKEGSPEAPDENVFQFPSNGQLGHLFGDSTTECTKDSPCLALSVPEVPGHVPPPPEGQGVCNIFHLQVDNHSRHMSQSVNGADIRSLEEDFQEKGSETKRKIQLESLSCQGFLSADDFQESLPPTPAAQEVASMVLWEHSPAKSREERRCSSDLGSSVSVVVEAAVEEGSRAPSSVPSVPATLQELSGLGNWGTGAKLKIITLEASVSEIWPPRQGTDPENREAEVGYLASDKAWALSDAAVSEADLLAQGPQAETAPALVNRRETCEGEAPVSREHGSTPPSQDLSPPRLLKSSVDPIDEKELRVAESLSEASETGWKKNANHASKDQGEDQLEVDPPAFFQQFLTSPNILESSVDPIDDRAGVVEHPRAEQPEPSESPLGVIREGTTSADGNLGQRVDVQPTILQVPSPQDRGETIPSKNRINQDQVDREREEVEPSQYNQAEEQDQPATWPGEEGGQRIPSACRVSPVQEGRTSGEAEQGQKDTAKFIFPTAPLSGCLSMTHAPVEVDAYNSTVYEGPRIDVAEPRNHQYIFSDSKERGTLESKRGKRVSSSSDLTPLPCASSPEGTVSHSSLSHRIEELKIEEPQIGETKPPSSSGSPQMTLAFISGECESETTSEFLQDLCPKGSTLGREKAGVKKPSRVAAQTGKSPGGRPAAATSVEARKQQETSGSGHLAEGVKKKILSRVAALRLRLEEKENVRRNSSLLRKIPKLEKSLSCTDEKKDLKKVACKREGKAPVLLKKIQAEMFPDHPGNVKLSCQFAEVHEDSTIWWTKDSEPIAQVQRSAGDNSAVSLAIVQASQKDQGLYCCCIKNSYGKVTAEFNLTAEVLKQLLSHRDSKGCEEIEFSQLIFREDFLNDSYFGDRLRGQIATEALHFGEGVHRKAFRSTVMQGLTPVFQPGHACVLKVHNAVAHGTRNNDELIQRNYKLAAQECYVQNTARYYAKIYAAEAQPLEGFGEVPEIIPIFLIHRPENNIPYATVEEELIGEFVKYSIRDGKEINFLRRESEAGQKCCTFQHWVYQKTSGCLLVTDMQGVGMKLTDVGIATLAKGYKGFKGNCSMTFIDQFKALHQCNKYCKMLGLKSLQNNTQKPKKPSIGKSKVQISVKKPEPGTPTEKKT